MDHHSEDFERMKADLHEKGYQEKDVTITSGKAMVFGTLCALPALPRGWIRLILFS